ncbi:cisplatin damage response ATP-dependent DNA ligase [Alphaproteobacteria bacterium]|nr:cisplatin damage response ATP-dependent DNA ligase [Alphaproteobacteria bacterium]
MKIFADLLHSLLYAPQRLVKQAYLVEFIKNTPDPDRGYALSALTGELSIQGVKAGLIRKIAYQKCDPVLFDLSYDFVGDLAETTALIWPNTTRQVSGIRISDIISKLKTANRKDAGTLVQEWLDQLPESQRWALLKLLTGGLRVGVSARMVRLALAQSYQIDVNEIEQIWPLIEPPYLELFNWLDGKADKPDAAGRAVFRPMMLAHPLLESEIAEMDFASFQAEWKWDGARIQLVSGSDGVRIFSRSGDDISGTFPEIAKPLSWHGVIDGELLAGNPNKIGSFQQLQLRLNRKKPSVKMISETPVFMRVYDILFDNNIDVREHPLEYRREVLEAQMKTGLKTCYLDLSPILADASLANLQTWRQQCRAGGLIEGLMLKNKTSSYQAGRIKGSWFKWKRDPLTADLVILYAQRGHGKRSSFFSDFTLGAWGEGSEYDAQTLLPVAKAYSGFTDDELKKLDKFIRENIIQKFGPVREVEKTLVVEIAFDSVQYSKRHKSGIATRFPRFKAIRWDKPARDANSISDLIAMIDI